MSIKTKEMLTVYSAMERMHNECSKRETCYKCPYVKIKCDILGAMPCELDMDDIYNFFEGLEGLVEPGKTVGKNEGGISNGTFI